MGRPEDSRQKPAPHPYCTISTAGWHLLGYAAGPPDTVDEMLRVAHDTLLVILEAATAPSYDAEFTYTTTPNPTVSGSEEDVSHRKVLPTLILKKSTPLPKGPPELRKYSPPYSKINDPMSLDPHDRVVQLSDVSAWLPGVCDWLREVTTGKPNDLVDPESAAMVLEMLQSIVAQDHQARHDMVASPPEKWLTVTEAARRLYEETDKVLGRGNDKVGLKNCRSIISKACDKKRLKHSGKRTARRIDWDSLSTLILHYRDRQLADDGDE